MPFASLRGVESIRPVTVFVMSLILLASLGACVATQPSHQSGLAWHGPAEAGPLASLEHLLVDARPVPRDRRVAVPPTPASTAELEPRQWKAVLVSGSRASSAYDAAAFDLGSRFRERGVARVATALSGGGGEFVASPAGIRHAMEWLGDGEGACLFFATGHGDVTGFRLDNARGDRTLTPGKLDRLLDRYCGDRPTVAIISGCAAGVFLDSRMRRPNRVLIAASAAGRDSYGARMDDRHVNFDRCLIGAIDAGASTWREAFERTLPCVREREVWLGVPFSEPPAYFGAAVADLAIPGTARFMAQMR